ncbi:lytic transglycosylase domain-containing protein [Gordonia zhaorongruii]|uniref:lytic transglycosylase domain-containing protein n=1 Tax=Gordonia zhaorongruii TaxID=2597659 RepID=UPI0011808349|nr:lytic transglycosylase domain-containing protein [Gordonia zhaorongruii]
MGISFWHHRPNRVHVPRRALAAGSGVVIVGSLLLGGMASGAVAEPSAHGPVDVGGPTLAADSATTDSVMHIVPASGGQLVGFAPPATTPGGSDGGSDDEAAQFRIAANLPSGPLGIPGIVLKAYKMAAKRVSSETPQCKLPWFLLAGIGRIESGHAGNGNVNSYGDTITKIRGPVLDGSLAGNEVITDTDGGKYDGDKSHDRAMGSMQFIPSTWASWGSDANGDGKDDPDNVFDASYAAGRYLCAGVVDIMNDAHKVQSVLRYNRSVPYANNVLGWAAAYSTGVMPTTPIPEMSTPKDDDKDKKKDKDKKDDKKKDRKDEKPSTSKKKDEKSDDDKPTKSKPSTPPSTSKKPPKNCLGPICLPPLPGPPVPGR